MDKAGERLKKIRLDKGISLEDVAKKTRVPLNILRSIEEDGFINLEPVYIKGFIKIYCNYLGVAPSDFITELKEPQVTMKLSDEEEKASTFLRPLPARREFPWRPVLAAAGVIAALVMLILIGPGIARALKQRAANADARPRVRAVKTVQQKNKAADAPVQQKKPVQQAASVRRAAASSAKPEQSGIRLGIHAADDCWMQVKTDGKTVFQSVLFRGRMESWTARDRIDLWLGSAGAVELEVNGSRIPSLGRKGQVLKNIVISKDGLKVGK